MKLESFAIILLFSLVSKSLHGQYIPIVEEGKFWIYLNCMDEDHPSPSSGHAISFEGDTVINSLSYKKVYGYGLAGEHNCPFPPCFQFDIPYQIISKGLISYIREDTVNRKVFNLPAINLDIFCETDEHLIFDFSLGVGDTLNNCIYEFIGANDDLHSSGILDSIKVTEKFGKDRTTFYTYGFPLWGGLPSHSEVLLMEGVGLEYYGIFHEPLSYLVDFCEGGMEACEFTVSTNIIEPYKNIALFPNPTDGIVQISFEKEALQGIRVFSMMGVFITEFLNTSAIDLSNLEDGIYLLEVILKSNERIVKKIVKCNR